MADLVSGLEASVVGLMNLAALLVASNVEEEADRPGLDVWAETSVEEAQT